MAVPKSGIVIYEGPSVLDGAPIVAVATLNSRNPKTGNMVQTWILRADMAPIDAVAEGADASVCGACPQRHYLGGACYVVPFQAPRQIWKSYKAGKYTRPSTALEWLSAFAYRRVRLGSYGDPAAVPYGVWQGIVALADGHTGYTHQARHPAFDPRMLRLCMVSVEGEARAAHHAAQGHRTFRVRGPGAPILPWEVECPASLPGAVINCLACGRCSGGSTGASVTTVAHGYKQAKFVPGKRIAATNIE